MGGKTVMQRMCIWCQREGKWSMFNGLTSSLVSTALDDVGDATLSRCIDICTVGAAPIEMTDKLLLKACGASVVSVLTSPIQNVGLIQRCQSSLVGYLEP